VQRIIIPFGEPKRVLEQKFKLVGAGDPISPEWRRISDPDYRDIQWTYNGETPYLVCNGIRIIKDEPYQESQKFEALTTWSSRVIKCPDVSVFDPDGRLPLVLNRTALATKTYPFHNELRRDALKDFVAFALVFAPLGPVWDERYRTTYTHDFGILFWPSSAV